MKFFISILIIFISCDSPQTYKVTGVIKEIDSMNQKMLIDHNEIPGFMMQMVMYFKLHNSIDIKQFAINDSVSFDLIVKSKDSYTLNYTKLGYSQKISDNDDFWNEDIDSKYSLKEPGEIIDDVTLLTTENKEIKLSELVSDFTMISFIFSKCPMPKMCPASIIKNQYLSNHFENENINFIIVSFDYLYDTPEVLKNVYNTIQTENMIFLSSFNHIDDIFSLTQQSGVAYWGIEENNIGHSMKSIIIDKDLTLIRIFDGIDWKPGDAKNAIENLFKVYK